MITVSAKLGPLLRQLRAMPGGLHKLGAKWTRDNARLLVSSGGKIPGLVQVMPPHGGPDGKVRGIAARRQGEGAISNDLLGRGVTGQRSGGVFTVMPDDLLARNHAHNATGTVRLFVKKDGTVYGTDRQHFRPNASISEMHAQHQSMRGKNGRVTKAGGYTRDVGRWRFIDRMVVSKSAYARYERHVHKRVGLLASAAVAAIGSKYGPLTGVPAWVKRHRSTWGSSHEKITPQGLIIVIRIASPYLVGEMQRRFPYVVSYRMKALERQLPFLIKHAAKAAGFALR